MRTLPCITICTDGRSLHKKKETSGCKKYNDHPYKG